MCAINTQLVNVVEQAVLERMQVRESFTALDISNALKADRYPFRHREIAEAVRDIYTTGAMYPYGYNREMISVMTDGGTKPAETWLYYHSSADPAEYAGRCQSALLPVPTDQARDVADTVASTPLNILPRLYTSQTVTARQRQSVRSAQGRRDGALAISRRLLTQLGWTVGEILGLRAEPGQVRIERQPADGDSTVRVWNGERLRVCKTKLRMGLLSAEMSVITVDNNGLKIEPKP